MILVCAATRTEAQACRRGLLQAGCSVLARRSGGRSPSRAAFDVLTTGVGPERAASALRARLAAPARPSIVVSSGFAGALDDALPPLAWVTATALLRADRGRARPVPAPPALVALPGASPCAVVTADEVLAGPVAGAPSPAAVDMESAALGEVAARAGLPFAVLRLVTDAPRRPLPVVARELARALQARSVRAALSGAARAALAGAGSPGAAARFLRDGLAWRAALREGWRDRAAGIAALDRGGP